jgi:hypothetical protein
MAGVLGVAATDTAEYDGLLVVVAVALAGMAAGRLIGRAFDRPKAFYPTWFCFWVEVAACGALMVARG